MKKMLQKVSVIRFSVPIFVIDSYLSMRDNTIYLDVNA